MGERVWVQMTISISGGRADGRDWPERWGAAIDLPAAEAGPLIRAGNAIRVDQPDGAQPFTGEPASATPSPVSEPAGSARGPVRAGDTSFTPTGGVIGPAVDEPPVSPFPDQLMPGEEVSFARGGVVSEDKDPIAQTYAAYAPDDEEPDAQPLPADGMNQPKPAAPKQEWVDYAMAHGETEDEANMQTKAQLMQKYGGRI